MFGEDTVICENKEQVEKNLKKGKSALQGREMKSGYNKTEFKNVNEREAGGTKKKQRSQRSRT